MTKEKLITKLRNKYLFSISNEQTFETLFYIRLSRMNIISVSISILLILSFGIIAAIAFTNLKEFIPGYDSDLRKKIINNAIYIDSLENELSKRDRFFASIQNVVNGRDTSELNEDTKIDSIMKYNQDMNINTTEEEEKFRTIIEEEEKFNLLVNSTEKDSNTDHKFFPPLTGLISQEFDSTNNHFGVDIVAKSNSKISTVLDGTVIFTAWTVQTGYVISVQHRNNLVSTYKHNSVLLKKTGEHVRAGEAIAILGNTGELTTGIHLHFELWKSGKAINPESYIKFK